jgi:hypothetical protein
MGARYNRDELILPDYALIRQAEGTFMVHASGGKALFTQAITELTNSVIKSGSVDTPTLFVQ